MFDIDITFTSGQVLHCKNINPVQFKFNDTYIFVNDPQSEYMIPTCNVMYVRKIESVPEEKTIEFNKEQKPMTKDDLTPEQLKEIESMKHPVRKDKE